MRNLKQYSRAITHQRISTRSAPMFKVFKNADTIFNDFMRLKALNISYETKPASIMFFGVVVKSTFCITLSHYCYVHYWPLLWSRLVSG